MRVEHFEEQAISLKSLPLPNQLILEYFDNEAALAAPEHADIALLRSDLLDLAKIDCE